MAAAKYGEYIKSLEFRDLEQGPCRQGTVMDGRFLGLDVHIQYGACLTAGKMGREPDRPHTHEFDQIMFWLGTDIYMEVSLAPAYQEKALATDRQPSEPVGFRSKYGRHVMPLTFRRKAAWYYGPKNRDDGGGSVSFVRGNDVGINFTLIYENMKKAPYRLCPDPDKPHAHANTQVMLFLGSDPDDLSNLGGEFEICMGKEEERHSFTVPTAVITPPFLPHWPGGAVRLDRPILMMDIHPSGDSVVGQVK
jgi:hypothetical protein